MGKAKNRISEKAAIQLLGRLFVDVGVEELTLDEVYAAAGRADISPETNRNWLNTVITKLRQHSLVNTIDKYENSRTKLDKLKITIAGKTALGWPVNNFQPTQMGYTPLPSRAMTMSYNDLAKAVASFRNDNPDFEVIFEVKLRSSL